MPGIPSGNHNLRVDTFVYSSSESAHAKPSGIGKRTLCAVYLSTLYLLSLAREKKEEIKT